MMLGIMLSCTLVPRAVDVDMETGIGSDLGSDGLAAVSSVPLEASRIAPHVVAMWVGGGFFWPSRWRPGQTPAWGSDR